MKYIYIYIYGQKSVWGRNRKREQEREREREREKESMCVRVCLHVSVCLSLSAYLDGSICAYVLVLHQERRFSHIDCQHMIQMYWIYCMLYLYIYIYVGECWEHKIRRNHINTLTQIRRHTHIYMCVYVTNYIYIYIYIRTISYFKHA